MIPESLGFSRKGVCHDEPKRIRKSNVIYPLVEWGMTEKNCLQYCYDRGFNWDGLYTRFKRIGCYLCPLQSIKDLRTLYLNYPNLWEYMERLDKKSIEKFGNKFTYRYSIEELKKRFDLEIEIRNEIFKNV